VEALVAKRVDQRPVAGFNLIAVVGGEGLCLHWDGALRPVSFGRGAHVVSSNYDLNDPAMPEKAIFDRWSAGVHSESRLVEFLSSHEGPRPVCKHDGAYGTVSSTLYVTSPVPRLLHAAGPPCSAPFANFSPLLG
jgi:hypothetical protein